MLNTKSVASNISYKSFLNIEFTYIYVQNSYWDHRNFDSVILALGSLLIKEIISTAFI